MGASPRQIKDSKLKRVREDEGWTLAELARAAGISPATLNKAEDGEKVRPHLWGKILKGINSMANKNRTYEMRDIRNP